MTVAVASAPVARRSMDQVYIAVELGLAVLSILGNVLVCWAVAINSTLKTATNYFLVSLAVADIAVGLLAIPFAITISIGFDADFHCCLFLACFVLVLTQGSIFSLLAVAVDRYLAIKIPLSGLFRGSGGEKPTIKFGFGRWIASLLQLGVCQDAMVGVARYKSLVTGKRARSLIAVLWLLSFSIGLTPLMGWNRREMATQNCTSPANETQRREDCLVKCLFENVVTMSYMVYFNFFGCVLLPLLIMVGIYIKIFMVACKQLRQMELMSKSRTTLQKEVNAAKSLAIIVGLFALCWLPLHILNCLTLFGTTKNPQWAMNLAIILSHANSVVNPVIYAYRIRDFRCTFHKILSRHVFCKAEDFPKHPSNGGCSRNVAVSNIGTSTTCP